MIHTVQSIKNVETSFGCYLVGKMVRAQMLTKQKKEMKSYGQCVNEIIDLAITYWLMTSKGNAFTVLHYFKIDFDEFFIGVDFILCGLVYGSRLISIHSKDLISTIANLSE